MDILDTLDRLDEKVLRVRQTDQARREQSVRRWWVLLVIVGFDLALAAAFSVLFGPWASIGPASAVVMPAFSSGYLFCERRRQLGIPFERPFYIRRSAGSAS